MDDLLKAFGGFGGAALMAVWSLARHTPSSEAILNYYLTLVVLAIWGIRALIEFLYNRKWNRLVLWNWLPAVAVLVLFVYPYQFPTAFPLHAELRADRVGTLQANPTGTVAAEPKPLSDTPGGSKIAVVTPLSPNQSQYIYHLFVENRSYVSIGPLLVTMSFFELPGVVTSAAVATPGYLKGNDGMYMYFRKRSAKIHGIEWLERGKCDAGSHRLVSLAGLPPDSWCVLGGAVSPSTGRIFELGVPKLRPHSSYDIFFEIKVEMKKSKACALPVGFDVESRGVEADLTGSGTLPLDNTVESCP